MIRVFSMVKQPGAAGRPVNASRRGPRAWRKLASIQTSTGIWIAGVIAAGATPIGEIPIEGAGFGD
jgi:hypothetical protein